MTTSARVDSIDSIKEFRAYLTKFQESASLALGDADSDIGRTERWLEGEQQNYWASQIRKRQETLSRAEDALRQKTIFKDSTGATPSAVDEQKAVQIAKKNLADAQIKFNNVKQWTRRLLKEATLYRGGVARFSNSVSAGVPAAIAQLGATIEMLEKYIGLGPAGVAEEGEMSGAAAAGGEGGRGTMARGAETVEAPRKGEAEIDPAGIRARVASVETLAAAEPLAGPVALGCGLVSGEHQAAAAALASEAAPAEGRSIAVAQSAATAKRLYMLRMPAESAISWCIGPVDGGGSEGYNKASVADLSVGRPDLADLLKLPVGSLVVLDDGGLVAIYNTSNDNILHSSR